MWFRPAVPGPANALDCVEREVPLGRYGFNLLCPASLPDGAVLPAVSPTETSPSLAPANRLRWQNLNTTMITQVPVHYILSLIRLDLRLLPLPSFL